MARPAELRPDGGQSVGRPVGKPCAVAAGGGAPDGPPLAAATQQGAAPTPAAAQREAWAAGACQR